MNSAGSIPGAGYNYTTIKGLLHCSKHFCMRKGYLGQCSDARHRQSGNLECYSLRADSLE